MSPEKIFIAVIVIIMLGLSWLFYRGFLKRKEICRACGFSEKTAKINQIIRAVSGISFLMLLIMAFLAPSVQHLKEITIFTADVDFAVDESRSKAAEKVLGGPNKLDRSKEIMKKLASAFPNLRVRIDGFTRQTRSHLFWTIDYDDFLKTINGVVDIEAVPTNGSDIGKTLGRLVNFFPEDSRSKIIILLSDGENRAKPEDIETAIREAVKNNVKIIAIGVGEPEGSPIPIYSKSRKLLGYEEEYGKVFISRLNEQLLEEIAAKTNGIYVREDNIEEAFRFLDKNLVEEKREFFSQDNNLRKIFLALSLIPLLFIFVKNL